MHFNYIGVELLLLAAQQTLAAPVVTARTIYEFEKYTWLENFAVRSNGNIILTSIGNPVGLHEISPLAANPTPVQITTLPRNLNASAGITEAEPDVFYFIASNASLQTLHAQPGSNYVYRLSYDPTGAAVVCQAAHVAHAGLLNGLLAFNATMLFAADSVRGIIWAIDTTTGVATPAIKDSTFRPPSFFPFTVNGLKFRGADKSRLYYTNTEKATLGYIPLHADGSQAGPAVALTTSTKYNGDYDDFIFGPGGNAFAAVGGGNIIERIAFNSQGEITGTSRYAGHLNSTAIAEPTAAAFGRTAKDKNVLYVTTGGAEGIPVIVGGKPTTVGAQLVAVTVA